MVDDSVSMSGPKAELAREVVGILVRLLGIEVCHLVFTQTHMYISQSSALSEGDFISVLFYNDTAVAPFLPSQTSNSSSSSSNSSSNSNTNMALPAGADTTEEILDFMEANLGNATAPSNLTRAFEAAMKLVRGAEHIFSPSEIKTRLVLPYLLAAW